MENHPGNRALRLARAHDGRGEEAEAIPLYRRALEEGLSEADTADALLGLGSSLRNVRQFSEAVAVLEEGVRRFPQDAAMRSFLALARFAHGQRSEALTELLDLVVEYAPVHGYERALRYYREELSADVTHVLAGPPLIVLGEIHGNRAGPDALWRLAEAALDATGNALIGIEASSSDNPLLDRFVRGHATSEELLRGEFFRGTYDGRANIAMIELLDRARQRRALGDNVMVFGFLPSANGADDQQSGHEQQMADAILERCDPTMPLVALVGNLHAQRTEFQVGTKRTIPMAARIAERMPLQTIDLVYAGGESWVINKNGLSKIKVGPRPGQFAAMGLRRVHRPDFDWEWGVGVVTPSGPAHD